MAYVIEAKDEKRHLECLPLRFALASSSDDSNQTSTTDNQAGGGCAAGVVEIDRAREEELETLRGFLNHVITEGACSPPLLLFLFSSFLVVLVVFSSSDDDDARVNSRAGMTYPQLSTLDEVGFRAYFLSHDAFVARLSLPQITPRPGLGLLSSLD